MPRIVWCRSSSLQAVELLLIVPVAEADHEIDLLSVEHRRDAKELAHVKDPQASHFDVVSSSSAG